ncbi:MAG: hypothetical protein V3T86_08265 [Planctomycetota bacterium]
MRQSLVGFLLGLAGGYLLAIVLNADPDATRASSPRANIGAARDTQALELARRSLADQSKRLVELQREHEATRRLLANHRKQLGLPPLEGAIAAGPVTGSRLPNGRIVGGARWPDMTVRMSVGYIDNFFKRFISEAKLNEEQTAALRSQMEVSVTAMMQVTADITNGDLSVDDGYAAMEAMTTEGRAVISEGLNEDQRKIYVRFEKEVGEFVRSNVVANEVTSLRVELDLDLDQERIVAKIVDSRYAAVQKNLQGAIPNVFLRPLRREADAEIFEETGRQIREVLRPSQLAKFDDLEKNHLKGVQNYRQSLVPR